MSESFRDKVLDEVRRRRAQTAPEIQLPKQFWPERGFGQDPFVGLPPRRKKNDPTPKGKRIPVQGTQLGLLARREQARIDAEKAAAAAAAEAEKQRMQALSGVVQRVISAQGSRIKQAGPTGPSLGALSAAIDASNPPVPVTAFGTDAAAAQQQARRVLADKLLIGEPPPFKAVARLMWENPRTKEAIRANKVTQASFDMAVKDAMEKLEAMTPEIVAKKLDQNQTMGEVAKLIFVVATDHAANPRVDPTATAGEEEEEEDPEEQSARAIEKVDERAIAVPMGMPQFAATAKRIAIALFSLESQSVTSAGHKSVAVGQKVKDALAEAVEALFAIPRNNDALEAYIASEGDIDRGSILGPIVDQAEAAVLKTYEEWLAGNDLAGAMTSPGEDVRDGFAESLEAFWSGEEVAGIIDASIGEATALRSVMVTESRIDGRRIRKTIRALFEAAPRLGAPRFGVEPARRAQDPERLDPGTEVPVLANEELAEQIREWKHLTDARKAIEAEAEQLRADLETGQVRRGGRGGLSLKDVNKQIETVYKKQIEPALLEMDVQAVRVDDVVFKVLKWSRTIASWQSIAKAMELGVRDTLASEVERLKAEGFDARSKAVAVALAQVNEVMAQAAGVAADLLKGAKAQLPQERAYVKDYTDLKQQDESIAANVGAFFMGGIRRIIVGVRRLWSWISGLRDAVDDLEMVADETLRALE